jgi:integrase
MAQVIQRIWRAGPRKVKRAAWGYQLMVNGQRERKYDGKWTADDARAALVARQEELAAAPAPAPTERTLQQLAEEYLTYKEQRGKRSLKEDRRILATRLLPAFTSDLPVRQLSASAIAQYERKRAGEVSAFTVSNELTVLRHMLRLGRRWGYLEHVPEVDMPKKPGGRLRYLELEEITRLVTACRESRNPYLAAIVILAVNTGMRKGEILGLEWERINVSTSTINLYQTKSGKPRGVPMNRAVYDALMALEPMPARRRGLLFTKRDHRAWGQIRTAFTLALERAKIPVGFRFHDLRHTCASHMVMRGASLKDVQEILGHADYKMTQRYAHLSPAHLLAAVERLDGLTPAAMAHDLAQKAVECDERPVNPYAPVAQVDRAAVS